MMSLPLMMLAAACGALVLIGAAAAQDVRGLEICTAEKQMERRTGCLQANVEFLQQRLNRAVLEAQQKQTASDRELAVAKARIAAADAEIAALKQTLLTLQAQVEDLRKATGERK